MSRRNTRTENSNEGRPVSKEHYEVEVPPVPPSSLARAGAISLLVAAVILVVAILPAEYGIDPTGLGETLGFTAMEVAAQTVSGEEEVAAQVISGEEEVAASSVPLIKATTPLRSDSMEFVLQPDQGVEVKVETLEGESFVFEWISEGGPVNFDMHGEPPGQPDQFTSYWAEMQQMGASGTFVAPITGTHGWFWRNRGEAPVTVRLSVSGFLRAGLPSQIIVYIFQAILFSWKVPSLRGDNRSEVGYSRT